MKLRTLAAVATGAVVLASVAAAVSIEPTPPGPPAIVAPAVTYGPTVTITTGGTYSPTSVGVNINTTQPVTLDGCAVKAANRHLVDAIDGADVTIRNCYFEGAATPNDAGWRAIWADNAKSITVENNDFVHISAVKLVGGTPSISILRNRIRDVIGDETNCCGGGYAPAFQLAQLTTSSAEIAWNEVVNLPGQSNMEDGINLFAASGASASTPIRIHDNFFWGAYPLPVTSSYSGGGILTGDGGGGTNNVTVTGNQLVGTTNYGIQIGGGNNVRFTDNRAIASGTTADGTPIPAMNTNPFWAYNTAPTNSTMSNNVWAWMRPPGSLLEPKNTSWHRVDSWLPACGTNGNTCTGNQSLTSDPNARIPYSAERAEWDRWVTKSAGVQLGRKPTTTTTTTAPTTTTSSSTTTTTTSSSTTTTTTAPPTTSSSSTTTTLAPTTTTVPDLCVPVPSLGVKVCPL